MALTSSVKEELAKFEVSRPCCRKAEASAMLRFCGGLQVINHQVVMEADLDTSLAAKRLQATLMDVFGYNASIQHQPAQGVRRGARYRVTIHGDGRRIARQMGILDNRYRPIRGLPPTIVNGAVHDAEGAWRGAFLAHGYLTEPDRSPSLEVTCPGSEVSLAMVGAARRLGISAKAKVARGKDRVLIREGEQITQLLERLGAFETAKTWEEHRIRREVRADANRRTNFDDANLRRSARAAVATSARVERALEILGDDVTDHLRYAGELRMKHKHASLEELGALAQPPLTKDAIAGRIRRLLAMADKRAEEQGIPGTNVDFQL